MWISPPRARDRTARLHVSRTSARQPKWALAPATPLLLHGVRRSTSTRSGQDDARNRPPGGRRSGTAHCRRRGFRVPASFRNHQATAGEIAEEADFQSASEVAEPARQHLAVINQTPTGRLDQVLNNSSFARPQALARLADRRGGPCRHSGGPRRAWPCSGLSARAIQAIMAAVSPAGNDSAVGNGEAIHRSAPPVPVADTRAGARTPDLAFTAIGITDHLAEQAQSSAAPTGPPPTDTRAPRPRPSTMAGLRAPVRLRL